MRHACFIFYLSGLLGLGRVSEMGWLVRMGGSAGPPWLQASPLASLYHRQRTFGSLLQGKKGWDVSALALCEVTQVAAWVWARRHVRVWVRPPEREKVPSWDCLSLFPLFCFLMGSGFPCTQVGVLVVSAGVCSWC